MNITLTPRGIETLMQRFPPDNDKPIVLRARRCSFPQVLTLWDGKVELSAILLPSANQEITESLGWVDNPTDFYLAIEGIVESAAELPSFPSENPLVVIAKAKAFPLCRMWKSSAAATGRRTPYKQLKSRKSTVQGGHFPIFLKEWAPFLSNEELAGSDAWRRTPFANNPIKEHSQVVSVFLEHYDAMTTLHGSNGGVVEPRSRLNYAATYLATLREFAAAHMDRQNVPLTRNRYRERAEVAEKIEEQNKKALNCALSSCSDHDLSVDILCRWHAILCGEGLRDDAGQLRNTEVDIGIVSFRQPEGIRADLDIVCTAVRELEARLLKSSAPGDRALNAATFAAAVFMGIVDVHPFVDGNERMARIAVNWALRRAGIPFVIHLCATPAQRSEYLTAINRTRRNVFLECKGLVTPDQMLEAYRTCGALFPLVAFILKYLQRTVEEFGKQVARTNDSLTEEEQVRHARRYLEREAEGNCLICLEDNSNIATLCCGKAVHLNCMAKWLKQQTSCPNCRRKMPKLCLT